MFTQVEPMKTKKPTRSRDAILAKRVDKLATLLDDAIGRIERLEQGAASKNSEPPADPSKVLYGTAMVQCGYQTATVFKARRFPNGAIQIRSGGEWVAPDPNDLVTFTPQI